MTISTQNLQRNSKSIFFAGIAIFLLLLFSITSCKVVKLSKKKSSSEMSSAVSDFNERAYIDEHWDKSILSTVLNEAHDLSEVLSMAADNPLRAAKQFGYSRSKENANYTFIVKFKAKVLSVSTASRKRIINLETKEKNQEIILQVGPVISGTAIRDSIKSFQYTDFRNQIEFAKVSNEIKRRVVEDVIGEIDIDSLTGKLVSFYGCFDLRNPEDYSKIIITPIQFKIEGE